MAGKAGAVRAGRAFVELFGDDSKLVRALQRASLRVKAFGAHVRNIGLKVMAMGAAMLVPLILATRSFMKLGDEIGKMSQRTGLGTKALSRFRFVASQMGIDLAAMENGFRRMQRSIYDASRGLSTAVDGLADLGLRFEDLDGLAPEEQFKIIAEALYRIKDPTTKAAIAMTLLGRSGTALLPMFAKGRKGIEELEEEARRLFLEMKDKDVQAAVKLTDALDALWKVVKMGAFLVGASLAKKLTGLIKRVTEVAVKINKWIDANRRLIVAFAKIAVAVVAAGVALVLLGTGISVLGFVLGGLATILGTVGAALGVMFSLTGVLLAGIVALSIGVIGLGVHLLRTSGVGAKALGWLGEKFGELKDEVVKVWGGIADALVAGDIKLAAEIVWLSLKITWKQCVNALKKIGFELKQFLTVDIWDGVLAAAVIVTHGLEKLFLKAGTFIMKQWAEMISRHKKEDAKLAAFMKKTMAAIARPGITEASHRALAAEYEQIEKELATKLARIDAERLEKTRRHEAIGRAALVAAQKAAEADLAKIGAQNLKDRAAAEKEYTDEHAADVAELAALQAQRDAAIAEAKAKREAAATEAARRKREKEPGVDTAGVLAEVKSQVLGTFLHAELLGRMGEAADDRTAEATESSAKSLEEMVNMMRDSEGLVFAGEGQ